MDPFDGKGSLSSSPEGTSRYGRTRRSKISEDFYNIDNIVVDPKPCKIASPIKLKQEFDYTLDSKFSKFDDLGARIANNFRTKLQRGLLNDSLKQRKFFKTAPLGICAPTLETDAIGDAEPPAPDVSKVLKLITTTRPDEGISKLFAKKPCTFKATIKKYVNKRRPCGEEAAEPHVESFGLPDKPIGAVKPNVARANKKIDVSLSEDVCVNLERPWAKTEEGGDQNRCEGAAEPEPPGVVKLEGDGVEFGVGDVIWAKIGNYPYWPCMVCEEPASNAYYKFVNRRLKPMYHVRFFGDNGRRSWVGGNSVLKYSNKGDLERFALEFAHEKKSKQAEAFRIKPKLEPLWKTAVEEAEQVRLKTVVERLFYFQDVLKTSPKRKRRTIDVIIKEELGKINDLPPAPSPPKKRYTAIIKKEIKREEILPEKTLEVRKRLRSSHVTIPMKIEIKDELLDETLAKLDEKNKIELEPPSKKLKLVNDEKDEKESNTSDAITNSSETDSKLSDVSVEGQEALYRRNNLLRGVYKYKICEICTKGGEILNCKGVCGGWYHYSCAISKPTTLQLDQNVEIVQDSELTKPTCEINATITHNMSLIEKIDLQMAKIMAETRTDYGELSDSDCEVVSINVPGKKPFKHVTADGVIDLTSIEEVVQPETPNKPDKSFKCGACQSNQVPTCHACNSDTSPGGVVARENCTFYRCDKFYHFDCVKAYPHTKWSLMQENESAFTCPRHLCFTCASDDPRAIIAGCPGNKSIKCLRCPASYHQNSYCIPAGSQILSTSQLICPRHFDEKPKLAPINTNWCLLCSNGGDLICCETCPTSVHAECLTEVKINPDERFYCEDCQSGRLPLYDEIVWVKLGRYRWWPGLILFPNEVPAKVSQQKHGMGEFVVRFYGTYDHYWIGRGRTFQFQDGDQGQTVSVKKKVDHSYAKALEEAAEAHEMKKVFKLSLINSKRSKFKPGHYIRIKHNKPVGNVRISDGNNSNTTACECDPNEAHPCGPYTNCLNRLLLTECSPELCPAGARCNNQRFERREYPPLTPFRTLERGWGLKTLAPVRQGQFVIEYVGELIDESEYKRRVRRMNEQKDDNYYFLTIDRERMLDAGPKGNVARFMNHSCQPNCETQKWTVGGCTRVGLFALSDIPVDAELTFNYNLECIGKEKKICRCEAPNCSGFIGVKVRSKDEELRRKAKKGLNKIKKKKPIAEPEPEHPCFVCKKIENTSPCNNATCSRFYHLECVGEKAWPEGGKWICSWHNCNLCSKRTIRCCIMCLNSYCPPHSEGNIRFEKDNLLGFLCWEHDPLKFKDETEAQVAEHATKPAKADFDAVSSKDKSSKTVNELVDTVNLVEPITNMMEDVKPDYNLQETEEPLVKLAKRIKIVKESDKSVRIIKENAKLVKQVDPLPKTTIEETKMVNKKIDLVKENEKLIKFVLANNKALKIVKTSGKLSKSFKESDSLPKSVKNIDNLSKSLDSVEETKNTLQKIKKSFKIIQKVHPLPKLTDKATPKLADKKTSKLADKSTPRLTDKAKAKLPDKTKAKLTNKPTPKRSKKIDSFLDINSKVVSTKKAAKQAEIETRNAPKAPKSSEQVEKAPKRLKRTKSLPNKAKVSINKAESDDDCVFVSSTPVKTPKYTAKIVDIKSTESTTRKRGRPRKSSTDMATPLVVKQLLRLQKQLN